MIDIIHNSKYNRMQKLLSKFKAYFPNFTVTPTEDYLKVQIKELSQDDIQFLSRVELRQLTIKQSGTGIIIIAFPKLTK